MGARRRGLQRSGGLLRGGQRLSSGFKSWEVLPQTMLSEGRIVMYHQIDRVTLDDGTPKDIRFNLFVEYDDNDQIKVVWEFGPHANVVWS
jgi:hypothetical protein